MFAHFSPFSREEPLGYIGNVRITLTLLFVVAHCLSLVVGGFAGPGYFEAIVFHSSFVFQGELWRVLSYGIANNILTVSPLWFLIGLVFFFIFGSALEDRIGRRNFAILYAAIWLVIPLTLLLLAGIAPGVFAGSNVIHLACFCAFAALFPGMPVLFSLTAKWLAIGYVTIVALQYLALRDSTSLAALVAAVTTGVFGARMLDGRPIEIQGPERLISTLKARQRRASFHVVKPIDNPEQDIDALLEKISRSGINSLSEEERRRLEKARVALLKREGRR